MASKELMTEEGFELLKKKIDDLEQQLKDLRLYKGEEAVHAGDSWHDNPTLYRVEAEERTLMLQITELKEKRSHAEVVSAPQNTDIISLGSKVEIEFSDGNVETYRILSETETNPSEGKISYKSPLGAALMGKKVGDLVSYNIGSGTEVVEIITIS
ncbi:GreA/GreB family elongation factor [Candidatus Micrarchaeota archaeon]|nr:GreA/GreB family elongation factor [Candidatus Micrarchaeota archaeon]